MSISKKNAMRDRRICGVYIRFTARYKGQVAIITNFVIPRVEIEPAIYSEKTFTVNSWGTYG